MSIALDKYRFDNDRLAQPLMTFAIRKAMLHVQPSLHLNRTPLVAQMSLELAAGWDLGLVVSAQEVGLVRGLALAN